MPQAPASNGCSQPRKHAPRWAAPTPSQSLCASLKPKSHNHCAAVLVGTDVITLDFINTGLEPGARAGIELTLETAKELRAALDRAIAAADFEEAEVRGKGAVPSLVRAA